MKRLLSFVLLTTFLNFEVSHALVEVMNSPRNSGDGDKKAGSTDSNKNNSGATASNANAAESSAQPNPPRLNIPSTLSWPQSEIDSVFASFAVPPANIPVLENALGDVVQDSVVNILDLLRVRDIAIGRGPAASVYEMKEGDLDGNGAVNANDVGFMRDVLLQKVGPPHLIDANGGTVSGAGVTMQFGPGEVESSTLIRIDKQTAQDIEAFSGTNFSSLTPDSTFFMTGFKVESSSENFIYPPKMGIKLDKLPPCELNGSNLLMTARRGPTGKTELVVLNELDVAADSTLLVPPPSIPEIGSSLLTNTISASRKNQFEPLEFMRIPVTNLSQNLFANVVLFSRSDGSWWPMRPVGFYPDSVQSFEDIEGIIVPVAPLSPGNYTVQIQHLGTMLTSNSISIEIIPLKAPQTNNPDSLIQLLRQKYIALLDSTYQLVAQGDLSQDFKSYLLSKIDIMDEVDELFSFILNQSELQNLRVKFAAIIENSNLIEIIDVVLQKYGNQLGDNFIIQSSHVSHSKPARKNDKQLEEFIDATIYVYGPTAVIIDCGIAIATKNPKAGARCAVELGMFIWQFYKLAKEGGSLRNNPDMLKTLSKFSLGQNISYRSLSSISNSSVGDPSFDPRKYPGFCINIWKHNTNAFGSVGGDGGDGGGDCPNNCCSLPPPPCGGGLGGDNVFSSYNRTLDEEPTLPEWASHFVSPLKDAIVTPNNGGIPGIVGIVDGAGSFAIPGLQPGATISFSVYDPHTGLFDPDAGSATAPNIAEQGVYFPVFLHFNPNRDIAFFGLDFGEIASDSVSFNRQRVEYTLDVRPQDVGKAINLNFVAKAPLSIKLEDSQGNLLVENLNAQCFYDSVVFNQSGAYKIRIAFGTGGLSGFFRLRLNQSFLPHFPYLCENIPYDTLYAEYSPYTSFNPANILGNDRLTVQAGTTIEFTKGGSITANGAMQGTGTPANPIVLTPETGSSQQAALSILRATHKHQRAQAEVKR